MNIYPTSSGWNLPVTPGLAPVPRQVPVPELPIEADTVVLGQAVRTGGPASLTPADFGAWVESVFLGNMPGTAETNAAKLLLPGISLPAHLLRDLTRSDIARLAEILMPTPEGSHRAEVLFRVAVAAAAAGDTGRALDQAGELMRALPPYADTLPAEPALRVIRPGLEALGNELRSTAKRAASDRLAAAEALVQQDPQRKLPGSDVSAGRLLHIARELLDHGTYSGCVQSAALSQVVIENGNWLTGYPYMPVPANAIAVAADEPALSKAAHANQIRRALAGIGRALPGRVKSLWSRAPLLVLLVGWLMVGVVGGGLWRLFDRPLTGLADAGFQVWALGFLALAGFGFYVRVRAPT
jgi:hypothetical protein